MGGTCFSLRQTHRVTRLTITIMVIIAGTFRSWSWLLDSCSVLFFKPFLCVFQNFWKHKVVILTVRTTLICVCDWAAKETKKLSRRTKEDAEEKFSISAIKRWWSWAAVAEERRSDVLTFGGCFLPHFNSLCFHRFLNQNFLNCRRKIEEKGRVRNNLQHLFFLVCMYR